MLAGTWCVDNQDADIARSYARESRHIVGGAQADIADSQRANMKKPRDAFAVQ